MRKLLVLRFGREGELGIVILRFHVANVPLVEDHGDSLGGEGVAEHLNLAEIGREDGNVAGGVLPLTQQVADEVDDPASLQETQSVRKMS